MKKYSIANISEETIDMFKECFDRNGSPKKREDIKWQFLENPVNKQYVDIALEGDNVAGIYAVFPVAFKVGDETIIASQSLDTIVDIDYRRKGLFVKLADNVYKTLSKNNIGLVYGFPNGNSIHGFSRKLDWKVLDPVPFMIRPLKTSYFTNRFKGLSWLPNLNVGLRKFKSNENYNIHLVNELSANTDLIWSKFSEKIKVGIKRNKEYLNWRYLKKPNEVYKIAECRDVTGEVIGFVIYTLKIKHGGSVGYIMELLYDLNDDNIGNQLLSFALNEMKKSDADCVLAWCFDHSPTYKNFKSQMFFKMPEKIRPIELHFGVRSFNSGYSSLINNRSNWFISYSDSDTV